MIYFLIALIATTLGAITGFGGGVIIKPVLDATNSFDIATIGILSSITVFFMAIVSMAKQIKPIKQKQVLINLKMIIYLGIGSVIGGFIGQWVVDLLIDLINNDSLVKIIQNTIFSALIILIFVYNFIKSKLTKLNLKSDYFYLIAGVLMGAISTFLGIGGGPINIAILLIFFNTNLKAATVLSISSILFSQITKLITILITTGFLIYDLRSLPYMVIGGILGGYIGALLNKKFKEKVILIFYNILMLFILFISLLNIYTNL